MLKIKCDINQQYLKTVDLHLSGLNNFHSLEVVNRVSETQLQVGENPDGIIWRLKGQSGITQGNLHLKNMCMAIIRIQRDLKLRGYLLFNIFSGRCNDNSAFQKTHIKI